MLDPEATVPESWELALEDAARCVPAYTVLLELGVENCAHIYKVWLEAESDEDGDTILFVDPENNPLTAIVKNDGVYVRSGW